MLLVAVQWNGDEWIIFTEEAFIRFLSLDIPFCNVIYLAGGPRASEHLIPCINI